MFLKVHTSAIAKTARLADQFTIRTGHCVRVCVRTRSERSGVVNEVPEGRLEFSPTTFSDAIGSFAFTLFSEGQDIESEFFRKPSSPSDPANPEDNQKRRLPCVPLPILRLDLNLPGPESATDRAPG